MNTISNSENFFARYFVFPYRSHQRCSIEKGFLKYFAKFTGNTCARVTLFNKVVGLRPATFLKKILWHRCL